ncbi:hypothetical protein ACOZ4N_11295 [Halorientalis pallida]|uniref:hypothetical protein n=1 Tax=Halorientalis pallida TaxID=2479928 RepID=UPI003C703236
MPLFAHHPDLSGAVSEQVSFLQLPDIVHGLTVECEFDRSSVGQQFVPAVSESEQVGLFGRTMLGTRHTSERSGAPGWKFIETADGDLLFDTRADPGERTDVAEEYPAVVQASRDYLNRLCERREEERRIVEAAEAIAPQM